MQDAGWEDGAEANSSYRRLGKGPCLPLSPPNHIVITMLLAPISCLNSRSSLLTGFPMSSLAPCPVLTLELCRHISDFFHCLLSNVLNIPPNWTCSCRVLRKHPVSIKIKALLLYPSLFLLLCTPSSHPTELLAGPWMHHAVLNFANVAPSSWVTSPVSIISLTPK